MAVHPSSGPAEIRFPCGTCFSGFVSVVGGSCPRCIAFHRTHVAQGLRIRNTNLATRLAQRLNAKTEEVVAMLHSLITTKRDAPAVPAYLTDLQTPQQFKAFLVDLLFDDLVDVCQGIIEGILYEQPAATGPGSASDGTADDASPGVADSCQDADKLPQKG